MSLLNTIKNDKTLNQYLKNECSERGVSVTIEMEREGWLNIDLKPYYVGLRRSQEPRTPDCFYMIQCNDESYELAIVELKSGGFRISEIKEKFATCFDDFMVEEFPQYFDRMFRRIDLFLVRTNDENSYRNNAREQLVKVLTNISYTHHGVTAFIQDKMSPHTITPCQ